MDKATIIHKLSLFTFGTEPGIGRWLSKDIHSLVLEQLERLDQTPLTKVQFNQLLVVSMAASVSDGFFDTTGAPPLRIPTTSRLWKDTRKNGAKLATK